MQGEPSQSAKPGKQKAPKEKGSNEQEDKANSIFITRELVNGPVDQIPKRLLDFKNIKNQNYEKFSERILENLAKEEFTFSASLQIFMEISDAGAEENTTSHQMATILQGFLRYWKGCKVDFASVKPMFANIKGIYPQISKKFISACSQLVSIHLTQEDFEYFQEQASKMVNKYYRGNKIEEDKVLPLVSEFELYHIIGEEKIVEVAMRYSNAADIIYIFKRGEEEVRQSLVKLYIDKSVGRDSKQDIKRCETVIRQLKLNPSSYHNMIEKMIDRYIMYQLRTFKLYFVELVVCYDTFLLEALVRQLKRERRDREAKYFMLHYHLELAKYEEISEKERGSIQKMRNILLDNDHFGPTETAVLQQEVSQNYKFLQLSELNFTEKNVIFVDKNNINDIHTESAFAGKKIGIDSQTFGGVHVFDQAKMVLLQIYSDTYFYIFDYANLQHNKKMKEIMTYIFTHCKIYGHDHPKQITNIQRQLNLDIDQAVMQQLHRNRLLDTNKFFKKVFPKETRSNLVYVTEFLLNRTISKYEQCSGWSNRPLRKAQMHYACLDCLLPLILGQKLQQIQRSKQKK